MVMKSLRIIKIGTVVDEAADNLVDLNLGRLRSVAGGGTFQQVIWKWNECLRTRQWEDSEVRV